MQNNKFLSDSDIDVFEGIISVRSVFEGIDKGISDRKIKEVLFCEDSVKGNGKLLGFLKARSFVYDYTLNVVPGSEIEKYAVGFKPDRIFKADMAALMLAIYEMKYMPDIPMSVSISEAVELVKTFSTEKSPTFVNGLLASVYKELSNKQK